MTKHNNSNLLVIDGGSVKTEEDGIVTGLGIVFGSENEPDQSRERDFFTTDTFVMKKSEFTVPLYYDHGVGPINDQVGEATLTKSGNGWKATARIDTSDEIGKKVYEAVKERPHGFSTGALQHLVRRESKSNNTNFVKKWVVGELSLTERPAERKAVVQSVKSVDGVPVFEDAWENDRSEPVTIAISDSEGKQVWSTEDGVKALELAPDTKHTLTIKDVSGSVQYNLSVYNDDYSGGAEISVYEWGGVDNLVAHLQNVLNVATTQMQAEKKEESAEGDINGVIMLDTSKSKDEPLDDKIKSIVKSMLDEQVSESATRLAEKESELTELRLTLKAREDALADLTRERQLEILTGAEETIKKYKGN